MQRLSFGLLHIVNDPEDIIILVQSVESLRVCGISFDDPSELVQQCVLGGSLIFLPGDTSSF